MRMNDRVYHALDGIKIRINDEYGFEGDTPRINYGPCGVFADLFHRAWNARFEEKVRICFVMTKDRAECDHVCIRLPGGELYDGGVGVHGGEAYDDFVVEDMEIYDRALLEKWSYGLDRQYPRFCPKFNRQFVEQVIAEHLDLLRGGE